MARGTASADVKSGYRGVWRVVRRVPAGRVATYGQIAAEAGRAGHARFVGYALHALPEDSTVPWHRIINARGRISLPGTGTSLQAALLRREGVEVTRSGRIDLERFQWRPR